MCTRFLMKFKTFVNIQNRRKSSAAGLVEGKYRKVGQNHPFKTIHPWKTIDDLAKLLYSSIVYNREGLIAINKPYGVPIYQQEMPETSTRDNDQNIGISSSNELSSCSFAIVEALPFLADALQVHQLRIIKAAEKYSSGILLLSPNPQVEERVNKSIRRAKAQTLSFYTYLAVTSSIPLELKEEKKRVGIKIVDIAEHNQKVAIIDVKPSKNGVLVRGNIKSAMVEYEVIKSNQQFNTALVQVSTSTKAWHFLRVYLAHKLAPIIGDALYSSRLKTILGKPTALSPYNKACYDQPMLAVQLCDQLRIPRKAVPTLPTHLHLNKINLVDYERQGRDLFIDCPLPDFFSWTCKQLDLFPIENKQEKLAG